MIHSDGISDKPDGRPDSAAGSAAAFLRLMLITAMIAIGAVLAVLVLLDPYGSGRMISGTALDVRIPFDTVSSKSSVARIRDPAFDALVIGNSTLQTLDPQRLGAQTGRTFAQVTVPGSGPLEQMAMLRYAAHVRGETLRSVLIGIDMTWCNPTYAQVPVNPFPFWLYEVTLAKYLVGLFRMDNVEALPRRWRVLTGRERPARADGFWNYELHVPERPYPWLQPAVIPPATPPRSAAAALTDGLAALPPGMGVVLAFAPIYRPPAQAGSFEESFGLRACKREILAAAASRARTAVVDRWGDTPFNRRKEMFIDAVHFREPVARDLESAAAAALSELK